MNADAHLLVVDDDERIRGLLQKFLIRNGFLVSVARDAAQARRLLSGLEFDLIVLDVMMPGEDGISLTRDLRKRSQVPILLLTAKGEAANRIEGFEAGADDYLVKPFEPKELLLRAVRYDMDRGELWRGEALVRLTATEAALMRLFAQAPGEPISRERLVGDLGREDVAQERAVDVQITRLRRKIEDDPKSPRYLQTVRGEGYLLAPD
jgi:two-component system phosphate regulon response regulator OmpR